MGIHSSHEILNDFQKKYPTINDTDLQSYIFFTMIDYSKLMDRKKTYA